MKTAIQEILQNNYGKVPYSELMEDNCADEIHQLLCDSMATAMYRCTQHLSDREILCRERLAEYGFSNEEIELSISKLEKEEK